MRLDGKLDDSGFVVILFPDHYDTGRPQGRAGRASEPQLSPQLFPEAQRRNSSHWTEGSASQASPGTDNHHDPIARRLVKAT